MFKKLLIKFFKHFTNPIQSIKFDLRSIYFQYCKFTILKKYKLVIPLEKEFFKPDYCDLYNLYKIIINRKPKTVVEIGSGYSTLVIAKALEINKKKYDIQPKLYSLEQDSHYKDLIEKYLKKNLCYESNLFIEIIKTELDIIDFKGEKVSICKNLPSETINFIYEDRTDHEIYTIAGDAIFIESKMPPDFCICVDGMKPTVDFYKRNLMRNYNCSGGFFHGYTFIPSD